MEVYFTGAGLPALAQSFRSALVSPLDIIPGSSLHLTFWHHLTYLTLWRNHAEKMLKESRGYINWHQLRIPTSNSHPKALKAPLKYPQQSRKHPETVGLSSEAPPYTHNCKQGLQYLLRGAFAIEEAKRWSWSTTSTIKLPWQLVASARLKMSSGLLAHHVEMNDLMLVLPVQNWVGTSAWYWNRNQLWLFRISFFAPPQRNTQIWCPMGCYP